MCCPGKYLTENLEKNKVLKFVALPFSQTFVRNVKSFIIKFMSYSCFFNMKHLCYYFVLCFVLEGYLIKHGMGKGFYICITVMALSFWTDRSGQTVQTNIRRLLEEQFDQGLHCLLFHLHLFKEKPLGLASFFEF